MHGFRAPLCTDSVHNDFTLKTNERHEMKNPTHAVVIAVVALVAALFLADVVYSAVAPLAAAVGNVSETLAAK